MYGLLNDAHFVLLVLSCAAVITIGSIVTAQQVFTQTPCYAALPGLCSEPPTHSMIVIPPAQEADGRMPIQQEETPNVADASFRTRDRLHQ